MSEGPGGPQGATAGGTLAMRMLSQQAMVASQMKRAANDKAIAQMLASKKSGPPAARLGDEIQHKSFLGALAGAVLGAIVTIAEGCLIMAACATGPYALVLVPALMYASYKASDYVEEKQNQLESWINSFCDKDGAINTGSKNVNINGKPAARAAVTLPPPPLTEAIPSPPQGEPSWGDIATDLLESAAEKAVPLAKAWGNAIITLTDNNAGIMDRVSAGASLLFPAGPVLMEFATMVGGRGEIKKDVDFPEAGEDTALCDKETKPPRIAQGSSNVFINNQPAARKGDKLECSAAIVEGSLVREYRYDSAGNVSGVTSREDYGRETRREYRLDRNGQVTAVTASGTGLGYGEGDESYGYDSCGYLKAQSAGWHRISEETDQYAGGHRLKQAGNTQYDYDAAGRMVSRTRHRDGYRPETERFRWDSRDQLTGYCSAQGEQWEYRHDASGRRTEKRCDRKKIRFTYLWDGDSIAEIREYRDDKLYSVRHLVFNGFELISQQFSRVRQPHPSVAPQWVTRTNHAVSDLTGRPLMLFNSEGKTVWRPGQTSLWGLALSLPADTGYPDPRGELDPEADPGLLYAGQWQDAESGLCYNRFRYYEPETGMYLVSDPLGLLGGEQTYRYVPNPCGYVDPLGLATCPIIRQRVLANLEASRAARAASNFGKKNIYDFIKATQSAIPGTSIPKSFEIITANGTFWVHPNATKHMAEYLTRNGLSHSTSVESQIMLTSFHEAVSLASAQGIKYEEMMNVGGWELVFSQAKSDSALSVIKHALYK
ncbi:RHS repeat-associated core domain-containing protein [Escherichia coli]|uniref:RHS repeat-associated core domain-containing protein n=1 Tax=Escherichia coli TaxID=562 RepID=UPI000E1DA8B4|nr:RHS repeat-associated core domain-containing protein [Escherichia coli]RDP11036.1 putative deoxyribonuclease RhsA [Escherichia coli]RDP20714.1 putative deoxyribonuclease RhsA [Escherichia coli]RDP28062.1 putative deoxyribonuclease RhsA [Escherichia coli]RDP42063.1 putative deoxyribonuclease RhsA [Escherichia coli]RDP51661.1 putative deoxyribonuclease RhsA [Escherichia coli]